MMDRPLTQAAPPGAKGSDSSRPRMVSIEIPITVQGLAGPNPSEATAFYEETRTVTVFAHGAVVRLAAMPKPGQKVLMTNTRMLTEVLCRVAGSRGNVDALNQIELEFVQASPGFWGISFPSEAPTRLNAAVGAPSPVHKEPVVPVRASRAPAPAPTRSNDVRGAQAVTTTRTVAVAGPAPDLVPLAEPVKRREVLVAPPRPVVAARAPSHIRVENPAPSVLAASTTEAATTPVVVRLPQLGESARFAREERSGRKWLFVGAATVALTCVLLAVFVFRAPAASMASTNPAAAPVQAPEPVNVATPPPETASPASPVAAPQVPVAEETLPAPSPRHEAPAQPAGVATGTKATESPAPGPARFNSVALAAPTVAPRVADVSSEPAPNIADSPVSALGSAGGTLPSLTSPVLPAAPTPAVVAAVPVRTGGDLRPPRLISGVPPVYPQLARQNRIQGDVIIEASIDAAGRVEDMKVVSGPATLHQAAMDALRKWRYEPGRLNGQPTATQLQVRIQFRL